MNKLLHHGAFVAGLLAIGGAAAGLLHAHPLALAMTALIAAAFVAGAAELRRFRAATDGLAAALDAAAAATPASLADWLAQVPAPLRTAVRLRVDGERAALPGPALTPYLTGLLVLLGMLGTFLGMVVTLNGTGLALTHASDLGTMRDALAAPVRGLGLAFGTSVAGVAASAMLGLMAALARRERLQASQRLDTLAAGALRPFGAVHRREAALELLHAQAALAPALLQRLDTLAERLEQRDADAHARLLAGQQAFHAQTADSYQALAASVDRSLRTTLADGARAAASTIQPVVEATMAGIAREAAALHGGLATTVQQQLDALAGRLDDAGREAAAQWRQALAAQARHADDAAARLNDTLDAFGSGFAQRADGLVTTLGERAGALLDGLAQHHATQQADAAGQLASLLRQATDTHAEATGAAAQRLADAAARLDAGVAALADGWQQALARHAVLGDTLADGTRASLAAATATFERQSAALQQALGDALLRAQAEAAARDERRAADTAAAAEQRDAALRAALERSAEAIGAQAEAQATRTIAEAARLLEAAAEAPRAAADVVVQLREQVAAGLARDNAMLEERTRLLETLGTLLDAVRHASSEQQAAIDALVASSAEVLSQAAARFGERAEAEGARLGDAATLIAGSAAELASLGEAFGAAVADYGSANGALVGQLQRIEAALGKTLARSDDQLAYYVAQARELIDLGVLQQQRVVEELQRLGVRRAVATAEG